MMQDLDDDDDDDDDNGEGFDSCQYLFKRFDLFLFALHSLSEPLSFPSRQMLSASLPLI